MQALAFVGRETEVETLQARVATARLVTVVGPPGVGKSALVAELVRRRSADDGIACVMCEARHSTRSLGDALLAATGVAGVVAQGTDDELVAAYARMATRSRRSTIVFDDADACLPLVARFVVACLAASRINRCVLTSREPLRVDEESLLRLDPLPLPEESDDPDDAALSPAVQLFLSRASAADARFRLTKENARSVTSLVRALEGLPLAIVSFAGRFGTLGTGELARQAERRADLFSSSSEGVAPRSRSLEGAIAASWDVLPIPLREAHAALSILDGEFGTDAALAVLDADDEPKERARVAQLLEALIDRSLLRVTRFEEPRRYAMLRAIRELARERLVESGREDVVRRAMVRRLAAIVRPRPFEEAPTFDSDPATFEQAFRHATSLDAHEEAARLSLVLGASYLRRGPFGRYIEILTTVLDGSPPLELVAELHFDRGLARLLGGARDASVDDFVLASRSGTMEIRALALSKLGLAVGLSGRFEEARARFAEARALLAGKNRPDVEGRVHKDEANVYSEEGSEEAHAALVSARACFVRSGNVRERAFVELLLASRLCDEGKLVAAKRTAEGLVDDFARIGDERSLAWTYTVLGLTEQESGRFGIARERYGQALDVTKRVGDVGTEGLVLAYFAGLELEVGELHEALLRGGEALLALEIAHDAPARAMVHAIVAAGHAGLGHHKLAERSVADAKAAASNDGRAARKIAVDVLTLAAEHGADASPARIAARQAELLSNVSRTEEIRFAVRCLARATKVEDAVPSSPDQREIVVAEDGAWIRTSAGGVLVLSRRPVLRRLVSALVKEREKSPGKALSTARLLRHVWPNEKMLESAAMNRLYVAITRLRDEGLADAIVRTAEGYLLSPDLGLRRKRGEP